MPNSDGDLDVQHPRRKWMRHENLASSSFDAERLAELGDNQIGR